MIPAPTLATTTTTATSTTTRTTQTTKTTTSRTSSTTTTGVCNGHGDPLECHTSFAGKCNDAIVGNSVRVKCPVMCDTCTPLTTTSTTTATSTCTAGQYLDVAINRCKPCPDNEYQDEAVGHSFTKCMAWNDCVAAEGQVEKDAPSASRQRTCWAAPGKACSTKPRSRQYEQLAEEEVEEYGPANPAGNSTAAGNGTLTKKVCAFTEECPEGFAVELHATSISDVVCTSCKLVDEGRAFSNTLNAQECTPWKTCGVDQYWEQPSGSTTTDIKCSACPGGQYQPLQNERKPTCTYAVPTTTTTTDALPTTPTPPAAATAGLPAYAYGAIAGGVLLLVLGISAVYWCLRKQKLKRLQSRYGYDADDDDDDVQLLELKSSATASTNNADYFDPQMTLQRKAVTLGAVIGEGNFGKVHAGTAKDPRRGGGKIAVAIKSPSAPARLEFEAEMEIMGQLTRLGGHPHIVGVVGCVYGNRPLLVLEFCAGGSLKAALTAVRTFKADGGDGGAGAPSSVARFGNAGLATCGHQVALAMAFLEQHSLLHRDLAARNVLLTGQQQQLECKLADFGLSRRVAPGSDYYRRTVGASAAIPVRWMAPETLEDGVSTISSDKWSFGVLLWEIYSLGLRPYIGVANHEIANHLRKGHRLEQPRGCPDEVYAGVMQPCWAASPAARPAFAVIGQRLHGLIATATDA